MQKYTYILHIFSVHYYKQNILTARCGLMVFCAAEILKRIEVLFLLLWRNDDTKGKDRQRKRSPITGAVLLPVCCSETMIRHCHGTNDITQFVRTHIGKAAASMPEVFFDIFRERTLSDNIFSDKVMGKCPF